MEDFMMLLISCYKNRDKAGAYSIITEFPDENGMSIVLMKILTWLRLEYKRYVLNQTRKYVISKSLQLNPEYQWTSNIIWLVNNNTHFQKFFSITGNSLIINPDIGEDEKLKALKVVFDNFETPLFS